MEKDLLKNLLMYYIILVVNIKMEKEMEKEKNIIIMVD